MLHIRRVNKTALGLSVCIGLLLLRASAASALAAGILSRQELATAVVDLTGEIPSEEQGYYRGIPGSSGGGATGGWRPGPGDTVRYSLPLSLEILRVISNKDGNFVFEILVRNTGNTAFDLPTSTNLTSVEKPENKSRRIFFFQLQPTAGNRPGIAALGSATTAGSVSLVGSFTRLDPGKSLRVLLLASSELLQRSFTPEATKLEVKATCNEWSLDDNRFFLRGLSEEVAFANTVAFSLRGRQIGLARP